MLIDTHCHLYMEPLNGSAEEVLGRASNTGVRAIVVPCTDSASWGRVAELSRYSMVYPAFGIHPWEAGQGLDEDYLKLMVVEHGAVAIGEIGLDSKVKTPDRETQLDIFRRQLILARELKLPVILHCRGAFEDMIRIIKEIPLSAGGVLHAFTRSPEMGKRMIELGLHLAFGGALTRPGARRTRESASSLPMDRFLLETDAPAIGMDGIPPEKVEPAHVIRVAAAMSELRGIPLKDVERITTFNALELFGIST